MKIIKEREYKTDVIYSRVFDYIDMPGAGFAFNCDSSGVVDEASLSKTAQKNYIQCLAGVVITSHGTEEVIDRGIQRGEHNYVEPAIGECVCGEEVVLDGFTNTCDKCHRDYNMSGQELAPREQWGEETGESLSDILRIK